MTVNPKNGRSEHVFVNLEALYPTPHVNGSELSFDELMAGHRGWLNKVWKPEISQPRSQDQTEESNISIDDLSRGVSEKLVIARDPVALDENGAAKEHSRDGRGRRMKLKEVNETQISRFDDTPL